MIESPCIGICALVDEKCIGCTRTSNEINNWLFFSDQERKTITNRCLREMKKKNK